MITVLFSPFSEAHAHETDILNVNDTPDLAQTDTAIVERATTRKQWLENSGVLKILLLPGKDPDADPPLVTVIYPANNAVIETRTPTIQIAYSSDDLAIDTSSLRVRVNNTDITSLFSVAAEAATGMILSPLPVGKNTLSISIKDENGNLGTAQSSFTVDVFEASISATPSGGDKPLNVLLEADVVGGALPYSYHWDIDGDGDDDSTRESLTHVFATAGEYQINLTVIDNDGNSITATAVIKVVAAPTVIAEATPLSGTAPLSVSFGATVNEANGDIIKYAWDFDNDGTYDYSSTSSAATAYSYAGKGLYTATLTVTDSTGAQGSDSIVISVGTAPIASAEAVPISGTAPLVVSFTGGGTDQDGVIALYEWDFDGDGVYDYSNSATGDTSYTYTSSGTFNATLRITDNDGLVDTDSVLVTVSGPPVSLPSAYPLSGGAPLTVTFFSNGTDLDGSPEYYDWDFDGDGTRDIRLTASMNTTYTYSQAGTYEAALTVVDDDGLTDTASVTIVVTDAVDDTTDLEVEAAANPSNGGVPLSAFLGVSVSASNGNISTYQWDFENDGTVDFTEEAEQPSTLGDTIDIGSYSSPFLADIDNDGDLDLFTGDSSGYISLFRNDGNNAEPEWTALGTITDADDNQIDAGSQSCPALTDLDGDGDLDMLVGESGGRLSLYRNDGSIDVAEWVAAGYLSDSSGTSLDVGSRSCPALMDEDGDGDVDLFVGESNGTIQFFRNDGTSSSAVWTAVGALEDSTGTQIDVGSYSSPAFIDIDNDGDDDLFAGTSDGYIKYIENTGNSSAPWTLVDSFQNEDGSTLDVGSFANPFLFSTDSSGSTVYILAGESNGRLVLYQYDTSLVCEKSQLFAGYIGAASSGVVSFADIDGDTDNDLFVSDADGTIYFYRNSGTATSPLWKAEGQLHDSAGNLIDVGSYAAASFADTDGDGDLDLYAGENSGAVYLYENDGSTSSPLFVSSGAIEDSDANTIDIGSRSFPSFGDIDNDGDLDLFIGGSDGKVTLYSNSGNGSGPSWKNSGSLVDIEAEDIDVGSYSTPSLVDIDRDGDLDLCLGESGGQVLVYMNTGSQTSPSWLSAGYLKSSLGAAIDVGAYSNITLVDSDGDDDVDAFLSNRSGYVYFYKAVGNTAHTYAATGTYTAKVTVTDEDGNSAEDQVAIAVNSAGSPTAVATAYPTSGDVPLTVSFSGSGSDPDGSIVLYEWDFDGDGTYDYSSTTSGITEYTYEKSGSFNAVFRVTDNSGLVATKGVQINSDIVVSTSRDDEFNPVEGEKAEITFTIAGQAIFTVKIVDVDGNVIKVLVDNQRRTTGTFTDSWDGTNTAGDIVLDGVYYFYAEYTQDDVTYTYDPRQTATYTEITPTRTWPTTFDPLADDVVEVGYTLDKAAEVSLYFWKRDTSRSGSSIAPVRTVFLRQPRGAGTYSEIWDGVDDDGVAVSSWDGGYPITLWVYELPDNAIIVTGNTPVISDVEAEPNYFSPSYNPYAQNAQTYTSVSFGLSKKSTITAQIINSNGVVIRTFSQDNRPAGTNTITWDGKDYNGNLVQAGVYSMSLVATDTIGNQSLPRYAVVAVTY